MAGISRLTRARHAVAFGLALLLAVGAAHGIAPDTAAFVGTWTFQPGSNTTVQCQGVGPLSIDLGGTRASIYPGTTSDLIGTSDQRARAAA